MSALAARASTSTSYGARTDHDRVRKPKPKKPKTVEGRSGKYKRPTTFIKPVDPKIFHHRFVNAFTKARANFDSTINYVLWDLKTAAPGMTLSKTGRSSIMPTKKEDLHRTSSLEERTTAAIAKLVRLGYVSQARKILEMSNQLRTKFSPASLATIARAIANVPSPSASSSYPTPETIELSTKWLLWELRPQLFDAAKRKNRGATYQSDLTRAIEEFMWCSFNLRDWRGVLETFDGTANACRVAGGGPPSVKMCQLTMQAVFARHYYDAPGKGKERQTDGEVGGARRGTSGANPMKDGYGWTEPSDHTVLFRKIAGMVGMMKKTGVNPLYPEVHAILLRELGWLVSSGKTLTSVRLVEDWLLYYDAAMAVRLPPSASTSTTPPPNSTSTSSAPTTPSEPSSSSSTSPQSHPPTSIILSAAEAILNILEAAKKHQLQFKWTKTSSKIVARQKREYLETTLRPAFDEVMDYVRCLSPSLGETIDQHAKTQSVLIRWHLLRDDIRAAWEVWASLVQDVEEAATHAEPKEKLRRRRDDNLPRQSSQPRPSIPPTTSLRLDSAYSRIFQTTLRFNDVDFMCMLVLPSSSRILVGRNPGGFVDMWRRALATVIRQSHDEDERLRLLDALRTLNVVLEEAAATTTKMQLSGGWERRDILRDIFTGSLVESARMWWSAADLMAESTKEIGKLFETFGVKLKEPSWRKRSTSRVECDVSGAQGLRPRLAGPFPFRIQQPEPPSSFRVPALRNHPCIPGQPTLSPPMHRTTIGCER